MRGGWSPAWWVRFASRLGTVAVWRDTVVDRGEIRFVVTSSTERRDDMVDGVSTWLLADVADASVASHDAAAEALPVWWERGAAVRRHAWIVPQGGVVR